MNVIAHFLSMSTEMLYGGIAALCSIIALAIFLRDISRGRAKPYLWSWVVRIAIVTIAFTAQAIEGATYSLALSGTQLLGGILLVIHILSKQRRFGKLDTTDLSAIGIAVIGVGVWALSGNALYAVLGTIVADIAATTMGVRAAFVKNTADSLHFWTLCLAAGTMATISAHGKPLAVLLIPLASILNASVNLLTILFIRFRVEQSLLVENLEDEAV